MADSYVRPAYDALYATCYESIAGWLNGSHPSVADGAVQRKVCFGGFGGYCPFSTYISVRDGGGFYVYKLKPLSTKYCLCYGGNGSGRTLCSFQFNISLFIIHRKQKYRMTYNYNFELLQINN